MTPLDQFDPFERRITEAIEEIAAAGRPAYLDDVLRITGRSSQRSGRTFWRLPSMIRLSYVAAAAAIIAVLAGGALLLRPGVNTGGPPSPSPARSAAASPTVTFAPESLRSTWIAAAGPAASPGGQGAFVRLVIGATQLSVLEGGTRTFSSSPLAGNSAEFDLVSTDTTGGCTVGDVGRYGFVFGSDGAVPGSDGTLLGLTLISDSCSARSAVLNRGWVHAIDADNTGGRGVSTASSPMLLITLPAATYTSSSSGGALDVSSTTPDRTLFAVQDPMGWTDPCSTNGGAKRAIAPTIAAFTAYLKTLPGFTVQASSMTIDGHPAAHLVIPTTVTTDCPPHDVQEWTTSDSADASGWHLRQGDTDVLYLVEVDGKLFLLQWLGSDVTAAEEQALFATVHFTTTLP